MTKIDSVVTPFNSERIINSVSQFSTTKVNNVVNTYLGTELLKSTNVTDKYHMFDFSGFIQKFVPAIQDVFTPQFYSLSLGGGKQQLKLKGDTVTVNGEEWNKMVWVLNSTDKSRALSMSMGLFRVVCSNGMIASAPGSEVAVVKAKHLIVNNIDTKVADFMENLENADRIFNSTVNTVESLAGRKFTVGHIANNLGIDTPSVEDIFNRFTTKLVTSKSDSLGGLSDAQVTGLKVPYHSMKQDVLDIEVDAYQAFQCYTEIFRNYDSGVIRRETDRVLKALTV